MKYKIVLITPGQPATNPRLVKEAIALSHHGFEVTVLYCFWVQWATEFDKKIIEDNPQITWIETGGNPNLNHYLYYYTRIKHKLFRLLHRYVPNSLSIAIRAEMRAYSHALKKAITINADLYIAHNLGALSLAANASKTVGSKYSFDAEDFHRGQVTNESNEFKRVKLIEDNFLPNAAYISAASPLIATEYENLYNRKVQLINNVFSIKYLTQNNKEIHNPISLFWFSQTVGKGRGLEDVLLALRQFTGRNFSLTILGKADESIKSYFRELISNKNDNSVIINFIDPVAPDAIFEIAANYDIGLAIETLGEYNRNICLTNKIFTYLLSGNAIIFSNTPAQEKFFKENIDLGQMYHSGESNSLAAILKNYLVNIDLLKLHKSNSAKIAATKLNWENEIKSLLLSIKSVL